MAGKVAKSLPRRLYRSEQDRMLAGICGGLGEYFEVDPTIVRLVWLIMIFSGGWGVPLYFILWLIVPTESELTVK